MRIRIALSLGALLLAGGAVMGTAPASAAEQSSTPPTTQPAEAPTTAAPATATPAPPAAERTAVRPDGRPGAERDGKSIIAAPRPGRVPTAIPAGPVGDLHLPAIVEGAGN